MNQIINYLRYQQFYVQRLNAGKYALGEGRSRRFVQGVETGTPDLMAFREIEEQVYARDERGNLVSRYTNPRVQLLFIEVKRPGKRATVIQSAKMAELEEYGARCFVATSIEDVQQHLSL